VKDHSRIIEILEYETGGHSYKSHKYSLDEQERSPVEYGEATNSIHWERRGETDDIKTYVPLSKLSHQVCKDRLLTYFLDGSRHVYKVDDMGFEKSGTTRKATSLPFKVLSPILTYPVQKHLLHFLFHLLAHGPQHKVPRANV
jgi:hypothetical protein